VAGRNPVGPDIVAIDRSTNRLIVVEAKGTTDGSWVLDGRRLETTVDGERMTQTSFGWLDTKSERYLNDLKNSTNPAEQEAGRRLQSVLDDAEDYDVMIVQSRPSSRGGYGEGMDQAVENIRNDGHVGDITVVDVVRPR
jgi:hypothetical protein